MNFNTVIAVAIAMSVKYAKVQANWFLKPLPQQLQVLPIQLIHRDSHIRMEQNDEYTTDTVSVTWKMLKNLHTNKFTGGTVALKFT